MWYIIGAVITLIITWGVMTVMVVRDNYPTHEDDAAMFYIMGCLTAAIWPVAIPVWLFLFASLGMGRLSIKIRDRMGG